MPWYKKTWAAVLFIFIFPPVGIYLIWKYNNSLSTKIILTVIGVFFLIVQIHGLSDTNLHDESSNKPNLQVAGELSDIIDMSTAADLETEVAETNINEFLHTTVVSTSTAETEPSKAPVTTRRAESTTKSSKTTSNNKETTKTTQATPKNTTTTKTTQTTSKNTTTTKPKTKPISGNTSYTFRRNENATISIKGNPGTEYEIKVIYPSGTVSTAEGLGMKTADSNGNVSWTWHIGGRTNPGEGTARISGGGAEYKVSFEVVVE